MPRIQLVHLAHARSGDKGDTANVGLIAYEPEHYALLRERVTPAAVKAHFGDMIGEVERFELPNLHALNFLLHNALDGGGTVSLMNDAQGKVYSTALLRMEVEVPGEVVEAVRGRGRVPGDAAGTAVTGGGDAPAGASGGRGAAAARGGRPGENGGGGDA